MAKYVTEAAIQQLIARVKTELSGKQDYIPVYTMAEYEALDPKPAAGTKFIISNDVGNDWPLYTSTGNHEDGPMTQKAVTEALAASSGSVDTSTLYITAGRLSGSTLGTKATAEGEDVTASGYASHAEGMPDDYPTSDTGLSDDLHYYTTASGNGSHAEGSGTIASGLCSHAEGRGYLFYEPDDEGEYVPTDYVPTQASGACAHAEGSATTASGYYSHAEGFYTTASNANAHAEGGSTTASGDGSHAEGGSTTASGDFSHAEGDSTTASGEVTHAEGYKTKAIGLGSHAEGGRYETATGEYSEYGMEVDTEDEIDLIASGICSHAEGIGTTASNMAAHAEGLFTIASGNLSHAEGSGTTASAYASHAEGGVTIASGDNSHAEGGNTTASGNSSHAEGSETTASNTGAHAEGIGTIASGSYSHAGGSGTKASAIYQTAIGKYNVEKTAEADRFIIGKGTSSTRSNAFRVNDSGVYGAGAYNSSGADYAEMFEWADGNPNNEDRVGRFVTLDGDKIALADQYTDFILGIVSGNPSVNGDVFDDQWQGMYLRDIYGRPILEDYEYPEKKDKKGNIIREAHTSRLEKLNPDYDGTKPYIPRSERPEWDAVGMLGKLVAIDDGTCQVNGNCESGKNGIATRSIKQTPYRVMNRIDENHIKVLVLR